MFVDTAIFHFLEVLVYILRRITWNYISFTVKLYI
uniref:Uncharacterized protein n=1 Tax=Rhizophora mucronata TaxID=61149 RepID=A0A2P2KDV6_RHIMU